MPRAPARCRRSGAPSTRAPTTRPASPPPTAACAPPSSCPAPAPGGRGVRDGSASRRGMCMLVEVPGARAGTHPCRRPWAFLPPRSPVTQKPWSFGSCNYDDFMGCACMAGCCLFLLCACNRVVAARTQGAVVAAAAAAPTADGAAPRAPARPRPCPAAGPTQPTRSCEAWASTWTASRTRSTSCPPASAAGELPAGAVKQQGGGEIELDGWTGGTPPGLHGALNGVALRSQSCCRVGLGFLGCDGTYECR